MFAGNFAPANWALCNGQLLPISSYEALFTLLGTTYGGDGMNTFAVPDLRGRVPVHQGQGPGLTNCVIGQPGGAESVTLSPAQMSMHAHNPACNSQPGTSTDPTNNFWAASSDLSPYSDQTLNATMFSSAGGSQPHENMMPYVATNYIIALFGIYPSPS
jgi:microcystin-dependent protein